MEDNRLLKPIDIPLIITSQTSSPEASTKNPEHGLKKRGSERRKSKPTAGSGSLKYEIGTRASSITNLKIPAKWSSVRIKGTGFNESRKSVVRIEPCNGMPNMALAHKDPLHVGLKSPNPAPIKEVKSLIVMFFMIFIFL